MNILHINTSDDGGAAQAAKRLHLGLLRKNVNSEFLCLIENKEKFEGRKVFSDEKRSAVDRILYKLKLKKTSRERRKVILEGRSAKFDIFTLPESDYDIMSSEAYKNADIIHLHWVAMFLDYASFFRKNRKPIVWTFHDLNAFTGGCHYTSHCTKFELDCNTCHQLVGTKNQNYSNQVLVKKIEAIKKITNLNIVSPSKWLSELSERSSVMKNQKHCVIQNGLDSSVFTIKNKEEARELLGLPQDKKIILFVSQFLTSERKGFQYLVDAIKLIEDTGIFLCSVGAKVEAIEGVKDHINLGSIKEEEKMSWVYSAADVFVIPSLEDNLPNTIVESLMCGTPVVGFTIGGIKEMIVNGVNGYLCEEISGESLMEGILKTLNKKSKFEREEVRAHASKKYDINIMSQRYLELYKDILKKNNL